MTSITDIKRDARLFALALDIISNPDHALVATSHAAQVLEDEGLNVVDVFRQCLARLSAGDWGVISAEDVPVNEDALVTGARILSAYEFKGIRVWLIVDAADDDFRRHCTTLLLPEDY